jgi:hypothetical protein
MDDEGIYVTLSLETDEDQPVADIVYRGVQWASLRLHDGQAVLTVYAEEGGSQLPLAAALASLATAQARLEELG